MAIVYGFFLKMYLFMKFLRHHRGL